MITNQFKHSNALLKELSHSNSTSELQNLLNDAKELLDECPFINDNEMKSYQEALDEIQSTINNFKNSTPNRDDILHIKSKIQKITAKLVNAPNTEKTQEVRLFKKFINSNFFQIKFSGGKPYQQSFKSKQLQKMIASTTPKTHPKKVTNPKNSAELNPEIILQKKSLLQEILYLKSLVKSLKRLRPNDYLLNKLNAVKDRLGNYTHLIGEAKNKRDLDQHKSEINKILDGVLDDKGFSNDLCEVLKVNYDVYYFCLSIYTNITEKANPQLLIELLKPAIIEIDKLTMKLTITYKENILSVCFNKNESHIFFNGRTLQSNDLKKVATMCFELYCKLNHL